MLSRPVEGGCGRRSFAHQVHHALLALEEPLAGFCDGLCIQLFRQPPAPETFAMFCDPPLGAVRPEDRVHRE